MTKAKQHTAGQRPLPQQRDERGRETSSEEQRLGSTSPRDRRRVPKEPHERDESTQDPSTANAASAPGNEVMRRAHDDVASGKRDTSRGEATDQTYHRLRNKP